MLYNIYDVLAHKSRIRREACLQDFVVNLKHILQIQNQINYLNSFSADNTIVWLEILNAKTWS